MLKKILLPFTILICGMTHSESGVIFYAGFEGTADAVISAGEKNADLGGKTAVYEPGKRGKSLKVGDGEPFVRYEGKNNIPLPEGSIEMWIMPVNWSRPKWGFHVFFKAEGKDIKNMLLYRFGVYHGRVLMYLDGKSLERPGQCMEPSVNRSEEQWQPGRWRHIVGTWSKQDVRLYVDGNRIKPSPLSDPFVGEVDSFWLGDDPWAAAAVSSNIPEWVDTAKNRNAKTLIDEVYIYNRALTDEEVIWAFKNGERRIPGQDIPLTAVAPITSMKIYPQTKENKMNVFIQTNPRRTPKGAVCSLKLKSPEGKIICGEAKPAGENILEASIPVKSFTKGKFLFTAELKDTTGNVLATNEASIFSPGPPVWEGNDIGLSETPPPPYTTVKILPQKDGFTCWNRSVHFDKTGFLQQVTSGEIPILAGPLILAGKADGKPVLWQPVSFRIIEADNNHIVWESKTTSILGDLKAVITGEYDGMVRYDFTLVPKASSADYLELRLPVRKKIIDSSISNDASLRRPTEVYYGVFNDLIDLRQAKSRILHKPWQLYMWLGNNEEGISGVVESDQAWIEADRNNAFRLEESDDRITMVWSFADKTSTLPDPWQFTIGIQATPVKDLAPARKWRNTTVDKSPERNYTIVNGNFQIVWTNNFLNIHYGYPQAKDELHYKQWVQKYFIERNVACIPYSLLTNLSTTCPEYKFYFEEFDAHVRESKGGDMSSFGPDESIVRMVIAPSYIDFLVWKNNSYVRSTGIEGLYHDLSQPYPLTTKGFGYERDGKRRPTYPVFALRNLYRRIYTMLKTIGAETDRDFLMINHQPSYAWLGAYCDLSWVGEAIKEDYRRSLSPEVMRQLNTNKLGYLTLWLPEPGATTIVRYDPNANHSEQPTKYLLGLVLLNNMEITASYTHIGVLNETFRVIDDFGGLGGTKFIPYWKIQDIVGIQDDAIFVSGYLKPDVKDGLLLCILNDTGKTKNTSFTLNPETIRMRKNCRVTELHSGREIPMSDGKVSLEIPAHDFRLLLVK